VRLYDNVVEAVHYLEFLAIEIDVGLNIRLSRGWLMLEFSLPGTEFYYGVSHDL
jgi:hypothetical protein